MTHHYRPARFEDCRDMADRMREQDAKEVMASNGLDPLRSLQVSFNSSAECHTIIHEDGSIVGMFGVADCKAFGSPWLLGTDKLIDTRAEFIPQAKQWVEKINNDYPLLLNYVHAENTVSKRWLKSLGFKFIDLIKEHGVGRQPFYQFVRIKDNV
jgi:hypothetical protein